MSVKLAKPWIIAHRGASGYAPENTMAAFRRAVNMGVSFIETDLQLTRDARLVAMHDPTLDRTTNAQGPVKEYTLAELHNLDAGSWFDKKFAGERIPTLEDIVTFARETDVVFYLEVKANDTWGVEHSLVAALRRLNEVAHAAVISFDLNALSNVRKLDPTLISGFLFDKPRESAIADVLRNGVRQIAPHHKLLTKKLVSDAQAAYLQVITWTVNEPNEMHTALSTGVNGVMTDYPDRLLKVLEEF
ncbi:MAG: glycerophosphodiester phosphodiesterase [Acidobacteria bacterium]|nr:glycerophosphodiester phosphodiesterase [Acidobacteriota bacterium]